MCADQDYIADRIQQIPGMRLCQKPDGAFYVMPDVSAFFGRGVEAAGFGPVPDADALCRSVPCPSLQPPVSLCVEAPYLWQHSPHRHSPLLADDMTPQRCFLPVCRAHVLGFPLTGSCHLQVPDEACLGGARPWRCIRGARLPANLLCSLPGHHQRGHGPCRTCAAASQPHKRALRH